MAAPNGRIGGGRRRRTGRQPRPDIQRGDIIVKFNGKTVHDEHELPEMVASTPLSKAVPVEVIRGNKHLTLTATIAELKDEQVASAKGDESPGTSWGMQVRDITPEIAQQLHTSNAKGVVIRNVRPDSAGSGGRSAAGRPGARNRS